jgi:hypothetical protein
MFGKNVGFKKITYAMIHFWDIIAVHILRKKCHFSDIFSGKKFSAEISSEIMNEN